MNQARSTKQCANSHKAAWLVMRLLSTVAVAAAILVSIGTAVAQRTTGTLRGQVLDPAGAAVANARVTAVNKDTGVSISIETTSAGTYDFPSLLPGKYTVTVEVEGFKKAIKSDVPVLADQDNVADVKLELGVATETVEVSAGALAVQTTSSALNNDFDASDLANLPQAAGTLNGSPLNLAVLAPNVVAQPGGVTGIGGSVGGTRPRENNFVIDGVDDNNLGVTGPNSTVIPDAVGEFALQANQFSAEYGHSSGGQFVLVTKTGTNTWHGSGEWYSQNKNFNSVDQLTKAAIVGGTIAGQPDFDNKRFGGTMGGPIVRDKLFVFGAYEYTTLHGAGNPTALLAPIATGLSMLKSMAANSAVSNILANFPVAPANDAGSICVHCLGETAGNPATGTPNIPIGNLTIISPVFQRENYVVAGRGVRTNVGRNSITTPGFAVLNLSLGKRTYFTEGKYLLVKADIFNVLNHPNFALSNGNVFSVAGVTTATTTQGYVIPTDPNFLKPDKFFSGGIRSMTLALKFVF